MPLNTIKKEKGQTLVIVIIIMILALTVGVVVSDRFIRGLRNITQTDSASRARTTAEALIERLLLVPNDTLSEYIQFNSCGQNCHLEISNFLGAPVIADATLTLSGASTDPFEINGNDGVMSSVVLGGYDSGSFVDVCWREAASVYASYIYEESSVVKASAYAYNPVGYVGTYNGFTEASAMHGYANCFRVTTSNTPKVLRVKPLNSDAVIVVFPAGGSSIPSQGILITATGRAGNTIKVIKVLKSTSSAFDYMDYVIYQKSSSDPLSNRPN